MAKQENNIVHGDQAGRDIIKKTTYTNSRKNYVQSLNAKFLKERENKKELNEIIDRLQYYWDNVDDNDTEVIGLDEKLKKGGYDDFMEFARKTKELFTKKLTKYQFSESAQQIYAYILAEIYSRFHLHVYPLIKNNATKQEINKAVNEQIITPVQEMLEENVLDILADDINGMIYFLTGNCHIKWL